LPADAPDAYEEALVMANELDRAAEYLIERLLDGELRLAALDEVQGYATVLEGDWQRQCRTRWRALIARNDVQAAINSVGRAASYALESRQ
jgi:hypothetical protein